MASQISKILVVSSKYPPEYSGSGHRAHQTYKRLQKKFNIQFDVLAGSIIENKSALYTYDGVKVFRIANKLLPHQSLQPWEKSVLIEKLALRLNYLTEAMPTLDFLRKNHKKYDLIHVFGNVAVTSAAITFCNWQHKPLIVEMTYDSRPQQYKPFMMRWLDRDRSGFHAKTQIVCISKRLENICRESGVHQTIWTRPNPVDTNLFCVDRQRKSGYRSRNSRFKESDIVLVNVAKFMPLKNQDFLIEVLKMLPEKYKLVLAGPLVKEGPNAERDQKFMRLIEQKIAEYRLGPRVQIKEGYIEAAHEYIKMADVYTFPSKMEGLGTPMIESICCGVPVVANRLEGVTDAWIKEGENGYLSLLDSKKFAGKVEQAAVLPENLLNKSAQELQTIAGAEHIDREYYRIIQSLINKSF